MSEEIVSELMRAHVYRLASTGQRLDGRALDEPRKVSLERAFIKTAEGTARVKLGNTDVLVGIKMSTDVRGNCSAKTTELKASEITFEISTERRSGPGRLRSVTLNGAMLYRHWTSARAGSWRCLGWASRGP